MSTSVSAEIERAAGELTAALMALTHAYKSREAMANNESASSLPRKVLSDMAKLQALLYEPADFLQQLSVQTQLLACMHWLGEFQVLTCVPVCGSVPLRDVAELTGVPEMQLRHVVRMMATAGFLHEPEPDHVAHSPLSAPFVSKPAFLDAAMFLSEIAAPAAMKMAAASHSKASAYNVATDSPVPFATASEQKSKLQRQWTAYQQYGMGDVYSSMIDVLTRLNWAKLGSALIVEVQVGAQSMDMSIATTFAALYPSLRFIVQESKLGSNSHVQQPLSRQWLISPPVSTGDTHMVVEQEPQLNSRITTQQRFPGMPQSIPDAAVYIIHLPAPVPGVSSSSLSSQVIVELNAHIGVLRANSSAALVLTARLLPEPGTIDPSIERIVGLRNLLRSQLDNEQEIESLNLMDLIENVKDSMGRLVLINKLSSQDKTTVAFEFRYQVYGKSSQL